MQRLGKFIPGPEALVIAAFFWMSLHPICDPDTFMHMATGRLVLAGTIPRTDPFSHTILGKEWLAHEWLAAAGLEQLYRTGGFPLIAWATSLIATLSLVLVRAVYVSAGVESVLSRSLSLAVAAKFILSSVNARPHMVTLLFLPLTMALLLNFRQNYRAAWISPLPLVFLVWANCHGAFILGGLPFLMVSIDLLLDLYHGRPGAGSALVKLAVTGMIGILATLCNPHGLDLLLFPLKFHPGARFLQIILEWIPPELSQDWLSGVLGVGFLLAFMRWHTATPGELFGFLAALFLMFQARRSLFLFAIFATPILCRCLARGASEGDLGAKIEAGCRRWDTGWGWPGALLFTALAGGMWCRSALLVEPNRWPVAAAQVLQNTRVPGRMFNGYNQGGYLVWALQGVVPVFIDGRVDTYERHGVWQDYRVIAELLPGWQRLLDQYQVAFVLEGCWSPIVRALSQDPHWRLIFAQDGFCILVRAQLLVPGPSDGIDHSVNLKTAAPPASPE